MSKLKILLAAPAAALLFAGCQGAISTGGIPIDTHALKDGVKVDGESRAPNISHLTFKKGGDAFLTLLDLNGVAASGGAACSAHASLPSHVMLAMGRSEEEARRGVRFSFGRETTEEETLFAASTVIHCAARSS